MTNKPDSEDAVLVAQSANAPVTDPVLIDDMHGVDQGADSPALDNADPDAVAPHTARARPPQGAPDGEVTRYRCAISGLPTRKRDLIPLDAVRPSLADHIRRDHPDLTGESLISTAQLASYRMKYVEEILEHEHGEFTELERQVAASIANHDTIAENVEDDFEEDRTFGQRLSDHLASFGGSWAFLIWFAVVMLAWIGINLLVGEKRAFDAYPFILLNLVLSCIAAIQAPIIMMSQKRQEAKDRLRALNDYRVNLKAELEIRHLHEKLDHLISKQWQRLAEIQRMQLEIMQEKRLKK